MYSTFWTKIGGGRGIIEFLGDVTVQSFSLVAKMLNLLLLLLLGVGGFLSQYKPFELYLVFAFFVRASFKLGELRERLLFSLLEGVSLKEFGEFTFKWC